MDLSRVRKRLGRIRRRFGIDVFDVFTRPVPSEPTFQDPEGYSLRWGTHADLERCDPVHTELDERERRAGARRLDLGHRLVVGTHGDLIVFTMWANPRNLNVPGLVKRRLGAHQWFIYKAFTSPDHRGRKLYEAGMRFVLAEMSRRGLGELVGYAHVKKWVSRKGLARLGFDTAGRVVLVRAPGIERTFTSKALRRRFPEPLARSNAIAA